jgi:glucokinase
VSDRIIAVDLGGTTIKAISSTTLGTTGSRLVVPTPSSPDAVVEAVVDTIDRLRAGTDVEGAVVSIGVASPGLVDSRSGHITFAANLGWRELALGAVLEKRFGVPVAIDNDARAGGLAEGLLRSATGQHNLVFVPIGTGVSASLIVSGQQVEGATGAAGEFGHLQAVPGGDVCTCGARGCIEAYASAASIRSRYARAGGSPELTTKEIVDRAELDPVAGAVWSEAIEALAVGVGALVALLDPTEVVFGGGLSLAGARFLDPVRQRAAMHLPWRSLPAISLSLLGSQSALAGAAVLARRLVSAENPEFLESIREQLQDGSQERVPL